MLNSKTVSRQLPSLFPFIIFFFLLAFLIYLPAFTTEYGMHNDYRFIPGNFSDRLIFSEAEHLYIVGRPLQAVLVTLQGWCINNISEFAIARFISFLFMILFAVLFDFFLRRIAKVEPFWSRVIVLNAVCLPPSQVYVLWVAHFLPGYFTLVLATASYLLLSFGMPVPKTIGQKQKYSIPLLTGSAFLFEAALFNYPINAVFVFACTVGLLLFSPLPKWPQTLKTIMRDILFFGAGMLIYFLANVLFFLPHAPTMSVPHDLAKTPYAFDLSANIWLKGKLIFSTFWTALAETGHLFIGQPAAIMNAVVILTGIILLFFLSKNTRPKGHEPSTSTNSFLYVDSSLRYEEINIQKQNCRGTSLALRKKNRMRLLSLSILGTVLFLLTNAPTLIAKECFELVGYRVLFPSGAIILMGEWGLWSFCVRFIGNRTGRALIKVLAVGFLSLNVILNWINVRDVCRNYHLEMEFLRRKAAAIDFKNTNRILLIRTPDKTTLIERDIPFEFSYMITLPALAAPIVEEVTRKKGVAPLPISVDDANIIFFDQYTQIIDFNEASLKKTHLKAQISKPWALVKTADSATKHIEIARETSTFFIFEEVVDEKTIPFWVMDPNRRQPPWIELTFQDQGQAIKSFTFGIFERALNDPSEANCLMLGSMDGKKWINSKLLIMRRNPTDQNLKIYRVAQPFPFKYYRFFLISADQSYPIKTLLAVLLGVGL